MGDRLVLFGGFDGQEYSNNLHLVTACDPGEGASAPGALQLCACDPLAVGRLIVPSPRRDHACVVLWNKGGGSLLVMGGSDTRDLFGDAFVLTRSALRGPAALLQLLC